MKKLLVTGFVRSGTTFLANFLNAQEDCLVYRDFLNSIFRTPKSLGINSFQENLTDREKNIILSELKAEGWSVGINVLDQISKDFSNLKELHQNVLELINGDNNYKVMGNKTTILGKDLSRLLEETDIHIIYIYRDIRDVLLSAKNRFGNYNMEKMGIELQENLKIALQTKHNRLLKIRFEDLILKTDVTLRSISDFLEFPIEKNVAFLKDRNSIWKNNSSFHDIKTIFDPQACNRWIEEKDSKEVKYCEIILKDLLMQAGYELRNGHYSLSDNLMIKYGHYYEKIKNFGRKILSRT